MKILWIDYNDPDILARPLINYGIDVEINTLPFIKTKLEQTFYYHPARAGYGHLLETYIAEFGTQFSHIILGNNLGGGVAIAQFLHGKTGWNPEKVIAIAGAEIEQLPERAQYTDVGVTRFSRRGEELYELLIRELSA